MRLAGYLSHLLSKWRYSPPRRLLLDALARSGLRITCYYLVEERAGKEALQGVERRYEEYDLVLLTEEEVGPLAVLPGQAGTPEERIDRLRRGHLCLAVKHGPEVAAFTWCCTREAAFMGKRLALASRQAYLYDTYTLPAYRGRGVAVFLHRRLYRFLAARGRDRFMSIADCANRSSIRFKSKLHALFHGPYLYFGLWKRYHLHIRLKTPCSSRRPSTLPAASFLPSDLFSDLPDTR
ncbi:MAG: GNAT family N-acetyltransferase [Desulfobacteraceae bacterium]|nr:GNAT family N-acetyltransferase [Desulfobacteraceae bacterium]